MIYFLVIGAAGVVLLLVSLIFGDFFDFDADFDFEIGGFDTDILSTAGIAGLIGGFGFGGAAALDLTGLMPVAIGVGLVIGFILAFVASWLTRKLKQEDPDAGASTNALVGHEARVLSPIPEAGYGQIRVSRGGHRVTLNAKSETPIEAGERVWVSGVISPTAVEVARVDDQPPALPHQST